MGHAPRGTENPPGSGGRVGTSVPLAHGERLLRGRGRFVDDLPAPGALHAAVVRSPVAHGRVRRFDATSARADARCLLVLGPEEIAALTDPLPTSWRLPGQRLTSVALTDDVVRYAHQPLGLVVARSRAEAEDVAELVRLEIDPLPVVVGVDAALAPDAPLLYPETGSNVAGSIHFGDPVEQLEQAMAAAAHVTERRLGVQRVSPSPMETRGVLVDWDPALERLTVRSSTQAPHVVRQDLATALRLRVDAIQVVAPDIGGSFGSKVALHVDEVLVCLAAKVLGRQVRWTEDRTENLTAGYQGRGQQARARLAVDDRGHFLALHAEVTGDLGAFPIQAGSGPFQVTGLALEGPYRFPCGGATVTAVYTNAVPTGAYRGYGMQEASWIRERLIDETARELGLDPVELRLRNLVGLDHLPYTTRTGLSYDSGDYPAAFRRAVELADAHRTPSDGPVCRGVAVTASVEITGFAPSALLEVFGIDWSGWEGGRVRVNQDGTVTAYAGVISCGQGIETTLAQIVADRLGVPLHWVRIQLGDTATTPYSALSSQASRSLTLAGGALTQAGDRMRDRMYALAARALDVDPSLLTLDLPAGEESTPAGAGFRAAGTDLTVSWHEVACRGWKGWGRAEADRAQLEESVDFDPPAITYAYGAHGAAVAVDRETGAIRVEGYWTVNDSGVLVNPGIAEGQIAGGVAQGLGIALLEEVVHDPRTGCPLTTDLREYALPTVLDVPDLTLEHRVTPSTVIPGGFKGLGEGGTIPPPATVAGAVAAAVPEIAGALTATPLSPRRIWQALDAAGERTAQETARAERTED